MIQPSLRRNQAVMILITASIQRILLYPGNAGLFSCLPHLQQLIPLAEAAPLRHSSLQDFKAASAFRLLNAKVPLHHFIHKNNDAGLCIHDKYIGVHLL